MCCVVQVGVSLVVLGCVSAKKASSVVWCQFSVILPDHHCIRLSCPSTEHGFCVKVTRLDDGESPQDTQTPLSIIYVFLVELSLNVGIKSNTITAMSNE